MARHGDHSDLSSRPWSHLTALTWVILAISLFAAVALSLAAAAAPGHPTPAATEIDFMEEEAEAEEWEVEEELEFEEEAEAGEIWTEGPLLFPTDCLLHTAESRVTASTAHDMVRLTIRYTSYTPTNVTVDYWLKGGKGSLQMKEARRRVGPRGVLRTGEHLSERAMGKVRAARAFVVRLAIPAAPAYCAQYSTQRLTAKHANGGQLTWSRPS